MALATPNTEVPLIRRKVSEAMRRSGHTPNSHAGKSLMAALDTYPRDELFQIGEDQLFEFAKEIAALADRPRVRVLPRIDRFDNFVSVLVFVPRDRYTSAVRASIGALSGQDLRWPASRPITRTSPKANWSASISSSAAIAGRDARARRATNSRPRSPS